MRPPLAVAILSALLAPPAKACNLAMLHDIDSITPICCGGSEAADCSEGFPARCSPACASLVVPFWDDCSGTMSLMGPGFFTFDVHRALPVPSHADIDVHMRRTYTSLDDVH